MASNFKILIHRNDENLHVKLLGDLDGSSAWELIDGLKKQCHGINRIFIHTNSLEQVHPFGREVCKRYLSPSLGKSIRIVFTGEKASELAPETEKDKGMKFGTSNII